LEQKPGNRKRRGCCILLRHPGGVSQPYRWEAKNALPHGRASLTAATSAALTAANEARP
jgi:hypothetical protein